MKDELQPSLESLNKVLDSGILALENGLSDAANDNIDSGVNLEDIAKRILNHPEFVPNAEKLSFYMSSCVGDKLSHFMDGILNHPEFVPSQDNFMESFFYNDKTYIDRILYHSEFTPNEKSFLEAYENELDENLLFKILDHPKFSPGTKSLNYVLEKGREDLANRFLDKGAKPDSTSLIIALNKGLFSIAENIIHKYPNLKVDENNPKVKMFLKDIGEASKRKEEQKNLSKGSDGFFIPNVKFLPENRKKVLREKTEGKAPKKPRIKFQ